MRKQRKPNVAEKTKGRISRLYYRTTWIENGKRKEKYIPLPPDEQSQAFDNAYWEIRSGKREASHAPKSKTWKELIAAYRGSPRFKKLAPKTVKSYNYVIENILEKNKAKPVNALTKQVLRSIHANMHETPRKADLLLQIVSILVNFSRNQLDWDIPNPAEGLEKYGTQREYDPWPEWMLRAFEAAAANDEIAMMAFQLGRGTGQRPGDLCSMEWAHFDGEYLQVTQDKQREAGPDERLSIYCPSELRHFLQGSQKRGKFMLAKSLAKPLDYSAVEKRFRRIRDNLGPEAKAFTLHGLRKNAASELAAAGCSDAEIQAVTGHKSTKMVQHYRKSAQQKALSKQAQTRREQNTAK